MFEIFNRISVYFFADERRVQFFRRRCNTFNDRIVDTRQAADKFRHEIKIDIFDSARQRTTIDCVQIARKYKNNSRRQNGTLQRRERRRSRLRPRDGGPSSRGDEKVPANGRPRPEPLTVGLRRDGGFGGPSDDRRDADGRRPLVAGRPFCHMGTRGRSAGERTLRQMAGQVSPTARLRPPFNRLKGILHCI